MINIQRFIVNMIQENCYVVNDETNEGVIIDCGAFYLEEKEAIKKYIEDKHLTIKHLLDTHLHFDHVLGNEYLFKTFGLEPEASDEDLPLYENIEKQLSDFIGLQNYSIQLPPLKKCLEEGDTVSFGTHTFHVIATPGHTPGGLEFYDKEEKILFSGDSLFRGSIGRTDFPGGNYNALISSLKEKILTLPEDVKVFPGHSLSTTIGHERNTNPYFIA